MGTNDATVPVRVSSKAVALPGEKRAVGTFGHIDCQEVFALECAMGGSVVRDIREVLKEKERQVEAVRQEVEALRLVAALLTETSNPYSSDSEQVSWKDATTGLPVRAWPQAVYTDVRQVVASTAAAGDEGAGSIPVKSPADASD